MREAGLGRAVGAGAVSLVEARKKAAEMRRLVDAGVDPLEHRAAQEAAAKAAALAAAARAKTFSEVGKLYIDAHEGGWKNAKHRAQWAMTLREYAGPHLGHLAVGDIETVHVTAVLRPMWHEKPETASRLRGRIEAVLDYATVHGWRDGVNPARWRGHLDKIFPPRGKVQPVEHHAALPWQELPLFLVSLRDRDGIAARALQFAILTATRTAEVLGATWSEIDLEREIWTIPKERMKAKKEHRVPLSAATITLLKELLPLRRNTGEVEYVFPGQLEKRPLSDMALEMVLRRMGRHEFTPHGFRSTFRDWAGETTAHPREVVEAALAHRSGDKVEQAYARGDLFTKRRRLMDDWASYGGNALPALVPIVSDHGLAAIGET